MNMLFLSPTNTPRFLITKILINLVTLKTIYFEMDWGRHCEGDQLILIN